MPDMCPLCMSPMVNDTVVPITEDSVIYDELVTEFGAAARQVEEGEEPPERTLRQA